MISKFDISDHISFICIRVKEDDRKYQSVCCMGKPLAENKERKEPIPLLFTSVIPVCQLCAFTQLGH